MKAIHIGWLAALAVGASLVLTGPVGQFLPKPIPTATAAEVTASPYIKIIGGSGTGSGVSIGHGYVLTAGHVAMMDKEITAKDDQGRTHKLTMLWANASKDIALLKMDDATSVASAPLSCDATVVGQHVRAFGNPMDVENVYASGTIVGPPMTRAQWESIMTLDMTVVPGMSGGALVNDAGQVVGITVGVMVFGGTVLTGFGYAVPSSVACDLLGRS